jgi:type 1 fimbriae regulatory protein FimB/type 1 fimbriae regulatory protein FimE
MRICLSPVHIHMFRHSCGHKLANDGQPTRHIRLYLGHRGLNHTARYTALSPEAASRKLPGLPSRESGGLIQVCRKWQYRG